MLIAIQHLNEKGIIHKNLKLENVMLVADEENLKLYNENKIELHEFL
jgi:serine/threonine protein kinase